MPQLGILNLVTIGGSRFNVLEREVSAAGLSLAQVTLLDEEDAEILRDYANLFTIERDD